MNVHHESLLNSHIPRGLHDEIVFEAQFLSCRYGQSLPLVLQDVSFELRAGKLLGVCGRTGSGKSTLSMVMLRCIEMIEGTMLIDGVDAFKLPLVEYRRIIQLFPQDSAIFSGTVRAFLDPYDIFSDVKINAVLTALTRVIRAKTSGDDMENFMLPLNMHISRGGGNLSAGQKQILALGRACLASDAKVVILDEITSNMDKEVASAAIKVIKTELASRRIAVLLIAHRMEDITACDHVMIMSQGRIIERGEPCDLLNDDKSILAGMIREIN